MRRGWDVPTPKKLFSNFRFFAAYDEKKSRFGDPQIFGGRRPTPPRKLPPPFLISSGRDTVSLSCSGDLTPCNHRKNWGKEFFVISSSGSRSCSCCLLGSPRAERRAPRSPRSALAPLVLQAHLSRRSVFSVFFGRYSVFFDICYTEVGIGIDI